MPPPPATTTPNSSTPSAPAREPQQVPRTHPGRPLPSIRPAAALQQGQAPGHHMGHHHHQHPPHAVAAIMTDAGHDPANTSSPSPSPRPPPPASPAMSALTQRPI